MIESWEARSRYLRRRAAWIALFCVYAFLRGNAPLSAQPLSESTVRLKENSGIMDGAGKPLLTKDFRGRFVILDIWASWCAPCVERLPELQHLALQLNTKNTVIIPVSVDEGGALAAVRAYALKNIRSLPLYVAPWEAVQNQFLVDRIPYVMLFDRNGTLLRKWAGKDVPSAATLRQILNDL